MTEIPKLIEELEDAAHKLDQAATHLAKLTRTFEGGPDEDGIWQPGPQILYEDAVADAAAEIYATAENSGKRPPPEPVREAMARQRVKREQPVLYYEYHRISAEMKRVQAWISAKKQVIEARRSVLSAEKTLAGVA